MFLCMIRPHHMLLNEVKKSFPHWDSNEQSVMKSSRRPEASLNVRTSRMASIRYLRKHFERKYKTLLRQSCPLLVKSCVNPFTTAYLRSSNRMVRTPNTKARVKVVIMLRILLFNCAFVSYPLFKITVLGIVVISLL